MPATEAQIRANRENAQKSTGPKTEAGKAKARLNALKHGMRSKEPLVLPQEDPGELEARIQEWVEDWRPQNGIERELVERAARASWALERAERYEAALLARRVRRAMLTSRARGAAKVAALGRRLFDIVGSFASGKAAPPPDDEPAAIVAALEDSPEGVRWMLDRWTEIRALIDDGHVLMYCDKYKFVRLLGKQAGDAVDDPALNAIFLAWEALEEDGGVGFWKRLRRDTPFYDPTFSQWQHWRELAPPPADEGEARGLLRAVVDAQVERLNDRLAEVEEVEGDDAFELAERASFLAGDAGERLRRLQSARAREMFRALQVLTKLRKESARDQNHNGLPPSRRKVAAERPDEGGSAPRSNERETRTQHRPSPSTGRCTVCFPQRGGKAVIELAASQKATNEPAVAQIKASPEHEVKSGMISGSSRKRSRSRAAG